MAILLVLGLLVGVAFLVIWSILRYGFRQFLFLPERLSPDVIFAFNAPFREIFLTSTDGKRLHGLYFPTENSRGIVYYHHGNRDSLLRWGHQYRLFQRLGYDVLIYDYRGYGKSEGYPNETNLYEDARGWYDWIRDQGYPPEQIIVYGRSLGAVPATNISGNAPVGQLILETPFASLRSLFYDLFPWMPNLFAVQYTMSNLEALRHVDAPVTVFHGSKDQIVPLRNAVQLRSGLKRDDQFIIIDGGYHNDLASYDSYYEVLRNALG